MADNLKDRAIRGVFWGGLQTIATRFVTFVVGVVLARKLAVEDFGLLAMLTIFIALAGSFINAGFGQALIQKKGTTAKEESSVFYFNILIAVLAYVTLYLSAPWVSLFYAEPQLTPILRLTALHLIIGSFAGIHGTLLQKHLNFKALFKVNLAATVSSGAVGITMAYNGFGVWSLVTSVLVSGATRAIIIWFVSSWRPKLIFSFNSLKSLFGFGSKMFLSGLIDTFFVNIHGLVIGKFFSTADLGFYNRGVTMPSMIAVSVSGAIGRVMFPVFSAIQHDPARMKLAAKRTMTTACLVLWPLLIGLAVTAEPFIEILLTDKWLPSVPYLQIMCIYFATLPVHASNLEIIKATGRSDVYLRLEIIKKAMVTVALIVAVQYGVFAIVLGQLVTAVISVFLNSYYTGKFINYPTVEQFKHLLPIGFATGIMAAVVYATGLLPVPTLNIHSAVEVPSIYVHFLIQVLVGVLTYIVLCRTLNVSAFHELLAIVQRTYGSKFRKHKGTTPNE